MIRTQLAVIGGGPGGYVAALKAAQMGADVTLIEKQWLGGVCLNVGCIPTKALLRTAEVLELVKHAADFGIAADTPRIDWTQVQRRKDRVVNQLVGGVEFLLKKAGVKLRFGQARLQSADTIAVSSKAGLETVIADRIVIATGSRPAELPLPGMDLPGVVDSTGALGLDRLPSTVLIIGGGVIGLEWASLFCSFGVKVTIVEALPKLAPLLDADLAEGLSFSLRRRGVAIHTEARVTAIRKNGLACIATVEAQGNTLEIPTDIVLSAVGRRPNVEGIGLEAAGVQTGKAGILVDSRMRTNVSGIYAVGDVAADGPMLAHVASHQGIVAVENALGHESHMDYTAVPNCVFTHPEAAGVGLTEEEARKKGYPVIVGKFDLANNGKALANGESEGFVKVVAESEHGQVLGVHIFGPHASDLILEATLTIRLDATLDEIETTIHPHPTLGEAVHEAVLATRRRAIHAPNA